MAQLRTRFPIVMSLALLALAPGCGATGQSSRGQSVRWMLANYSFVKHDPNAKTFCANLEPELTLRTSPTNEPSITIIGNEVYDPDASVHARKRWIQIDLTNGVQLAPATYGSGNGTARIFIATGTDAPLNTDGEWSTESTGLFDLTFSHFDLASGRATGTFSFCAKQDPSDPRILMIFDGSFVNIPINDQR